MTEKQAAALLRWYGANRRELPWRREPAHAYHVWVSEIMLQQTRVEAVKGYFTRFVGELPAARDLANVEDDRLLKLWEGLGYYSRARNLKKAAQVIVRDYNGALPRRPEELLRLPGVGLYTAGAVASIAYGVPVPAVDGNVLRVLARLEADYADIAQEKTKRAVAARLLREMPQSQPGNFNQALMELGACVCVPGGAPRCGRCPWNGDCAALRQGLIEVLPVKAAKPPRRVEERRLLILRWGDRLALRRRPERGLLAGLWELPEAFDVPPQLVIARAPAGGAVHRFTHIEWRMTAEKLVLCAPPEAPGLVWVTQEELQNDCALPSAFAAFRKTLF